MKLPVGLLLLSLSYSWGVSAQQIELSFPALPERKVHIYYFKGARTDSLLLALDRSGTGKARLPEGHKGFMQVHIPGSGFIECIGGEPLLKIESGETFIDNEHAAFPDSPENSFLYRIFKENSLNLSRGSWLRSGLDLYDPQSDTYRLLEKENRKNEEQRATIAAQIRETDLYASRLTGFMNYIDDLGAALDTRDTLSFSRIKACLHTEMDWQALYTSGALWTTVNEYYAGLFGLLSGKEKEMLYVEDILPLFGQLQEPVRSAFLETAYGICEKSGWDTAKDHILSYILENGITIDAGNGNLKRILSSEKTGQGKPAPPVKGLADDRFGGISLVLFYESGCDHCLMELEALEKQYALLHNSGIRVVSVSADVDERVYAYHSRSFPWPDKLCDYKGVTGENFTAYAITAMPTFFVIGNGVIMGRYSSLSGTGLF
jgi:thiol-disulfide isomerase/thioredoxin